MKLSKKMKTCTHILFNNNAAIILGVQHILLSGEFANRTLNQNKLDLFMKNYNRVYMDSIVRKVTVKPDGVKLSVRVESNNPYVQLKFTGYSNISLKFVQT